MSAQQDTARLTPAMRDALQKARRGPLRRVHDDKPGRPGWPAHHSTLAALVRHGLLTRDERRSKRGYPLQEWEITDAGREALEPPPPKSRPDRPIYLARMPQQSGPFEGVDLAGQVVPKTDYTSTPDRALLSAGEVLPDPDPRWVRAAAERHAEADNRRERARRLRNMRKAA